ncbi:glycosyltransferase family 2 protein [Aeromonas veronii]|uniref:glycosyltransferase family 2 protein n=1 Tax=Aeromonas veronii TaxID=654 RepID=UPI003D1EDD32
MKVSILMAAYNAEQYIIQAIESVQQQTFNDWELIIVDDGSTDNTAFLASKVAGDDPRIKVITQLNMGAQIARNTAFFASKGEYIVILDADDRLLPNKLAIQVQFLDKIPGVGVVYGDTWHCDHNLEHLKLESEKYPRQHVSGDIFDKIILGNVFSVHAGMVRRECIDTVGLHNTNPDLIGDWDFWVRVAEKYSFYYHPDPVSEYRFHPGMSAKTDVALKQLKQRLGVVINIEKMQRFSKLGRITRSEFYFSNGRFAHIFGLKKEALKQYRKSLSVFPFNIKSIVLYVFTTVEIICNF